MITPQYIKNKIISVLNALGIMVDVSEDDTDLREYIQDSIQFITFAVYLEQEFELELPEDLLLIDSLASLNNFSQRVCDIIERNMVTTK